MKILIASPDRDFLSGYRKLFELNGDEVTVAFDGFQFMAYLQERKYDFAFLDRSLPRVEHEKLLRVINDIGIPVIVLQGMRMTAKLLMQEALANSYLIYPFSPQELFVRTEEVLQKRRNAGMHMIGGVQVDLAGFTLDGKIRVTNEEINILQFLMAGKDAEGRKDGATAQLPVRHGMYYVNALNQKFAMLHRKTEIKYVMNEGYELVV